MRGIGGRFHFGIVYVFNAFACSFAYIGEEMKANKGPLLQNVESKPFVPDNNDLRQSELLSPDQILKVSETLDPLEIQEGGNSFLNAFDLDHFVEVTNDLTTKQDLESSIMRLFLNESQYQINNDLHARVRGICKGFRLFLYH